FPPTLCNCLADYPPAETGGLTCHLTIPLQSSNSSSWPLASTNMLGALVLAYPSPPRISTLQRRQLRWLGEGMAAVLEIVSLQYQSQTYAVQNAFLVLLARLVNEYRQSDALFSQILEQTLPLFNAIAGVIWLLSEDGRRLERAAHLSTLGYTLYQQPARRPADGGIAGRVIQNRRTVQLSVPTDDPHFDPLLDGLDSLGPYTLLAVPLQYRDTVVGMLSLYARNPRYFSPQNVLLLESITSLTASAIIHMQLVQKLRDYGRQKTVLYEMGQQISTTLNLSITLRRTLQWTARLTGTELGLLWLVESKQEHHPFRLAAVMGVHLPPEQEIFFEPERDRSAIALQKREAVLFNTLTGDTHADATLRRLLQPPPRNLIAAPIIYREQTIGLIELFDKSNGPFTEEDRSLLTTALKMAALAIGNAYLHNRTLNLLDERHHLQRQIIQSERLATLGRLTAALAHEINNPMQAIQGALMLALEELDNPAELETYLNLGLEESQRVIDLVHRMRQIYRPVPTRPEQVDVNRILQSALNLAQKELKRRHVTPCTDLATDLPRTTAVADQLHLVFLSLLLNLGEAIGEGGSALHIRTRADADTDAILITFAADVPAAAAGRLTSLISPSSAPTLPLETNLSFGLSFSRDLVAAHNGRLDVRLEEGHVACTIHLPIQR
ncbi:MAG: GAF domain-containing protein, partial [Caldilineae bacterium]